MADMRVDEAQEYLVGQPVEDSGDTCQVAGKRMEYATCGRFHKFGPQNLGRGSGKRTTRGGIEELTTRLSYLMKSAVAIRSSLC